MKQDIVKIIYDRFDKWSTARFGFACNKGCAACCTTDVVITDPEGQLILEYIVVTHTSEWLDEKLKAPIVRRPLFQTTNVYAKNCLEGRESKGEEVRRGGVCPFLVEEQCSIYPARPFACRCFASTVCCRNGGNALLPPEYLAAATAVSQIVEHVGQFGRWGAMSDVLALQAAEAGYLNRPKGEDSLSAAQDNCLTAQPVPGFLIENEHRNTVTHLLEDIFSARLKGRTLEDILNSR